MRTTKNMTSSCNEEQFDQLKRGPWTLEEDNLLIHYISCHGEGRWNYLAKSAGLNRTGKSCRLRWLNYLRPDVKRGNLTPQEQILILKLHYKWGNRWSKIVQYLPGRTDNEIKNYWRTRVQKHARCLKLDSSSKGFVEAIQRFWIPRLLEKVEQTSSSFTSSVTTSSSMVSDQNKKDHHPQAEQNLFTVSSRAQPSNKKFINSSLSINAFDSFGIMLPQLSKMEKRYDDSLFYNSSIQTSDYDDMDISGFDLTSCVHSDYMPSLNFDVADADRTNSDGMADNDTYWNMDELWQFKE